MFSTVGQWIGGGLVGIILDRYCVPHITRTVAHLARRRALRNASEAPCPPPGRDFPLYRLGNLEFPLPTSLARPVRHTAQTR